MERLRASPRLGLQFLLAAVAVSALVYAAIAVERYDRGQDRGLAQQFASLPESLMVLELRYEVGRPGDEDPG